MTNAQTEHTCFNCGTGDRTMPLVALLFQGQTHHICPQCMPVLIHHTERLAERLPGLHASNPAAES